MAVFACYFLLCSRLRYFEEWQWDAEVDKVYPVLAYYNRAYGVRDFVAEWRYGSALNFYRLLYGNDTIRDIRHPAESHPLDAPVYILKGDSDRDFIERQGLRIVYRGGITDVVVAIRPGVETGASTAAGH
jgi:hypothetical protein